MSGTVKSPASESAAGTGRRWGVLWVAAGAAMWGTDPVLRRPLTSQLPVPQIVAAEHVILSCILLPVLWHFRAEWRKLAARHWAAILAISWGGSALGTLLFTEAIRAGNPTSAVFLQKTQPLFAALLASVLLHEPLGIRFWSHAALGMSGAYLVSFGNRSPFRALIETEWIPAVLALGAAALWGGSTVLGRLVLNRVSFAVLTALRIVSATPLLLLLALASPEGAPQATDRSFLIWLVLLALIPGLAALLLYYRGLSRTRASLAAIAELTFPATALLLNWLFLDARVTALQLTGFILLFGVIFHLDWPGGTEPRR